MKEIFVNLKRFDVSRNLGGVCPDSNPKQWIEQVMAQCVQLDLGRRDDLAVTFFLPEGLILAAQEELSIHPKEATRMIRLGCQGVFREDVVKGGNFGAFTTNRPAAAVRGMGCSWTLIGHSEERQDKLGIMAAYDSSVLEDEDQRNQAKKAVDGLINAEVLCALRANLDVLVCVGETAAEKGDGEFEAQKPRIESVLRSQLETGLKGVAEFSGDRKIVIGYEPIWAIGPGKIPPGSDYIAFVSAFIKKATKELYGFVPAVVYGGGLKEENAALITGIPTIDGGLVALTRFSGEIGFYPEEFRSIIEQIS